MEKINLNVSAPDEVASVLSEAADAFRESAAELESAWQDRSAGHIWDLIAKELDASAARIASIVKKYYR